jgi:tRNA 2-thiouridine synthesizing protein A
VDITQDQTLDITSFFCPMTFVHTRLALDRMTSGEKLVLILNDGDARRNVAASAQALGHVIEADESLPDNRARLVIRK